ncbi:MAG TPA: wax ester/triacylglycerol synthase family O-acyltransferase [Candidatus Angelobacter sp.]
MQQQRNHDRLAWGDAVFLYLEREGVPMHIASVSVLEGAVSLEHCIRLIESKIPLIPRYRQRVVAPLFNIGRPVWEFDPAFKVTNHVREVTLKEGSESEFKTLAAEILSKVMDRQHPLWDITLVRGLKGGRTGFLSRVHHCLADGMAGVELMNAILSPQPTAPPPSGKPRRFRVPPPRDPWTSVLDDWMSSYTSIVEQVLTAQADALKIAERIVSRPEVIQRDKLKKLLPELAAPTESLHFNVTCQGPQKVAWVEIPLADIKAVKDIYRCSVNDVALALITATIRQYALLHANSIKGRLLRIMVPVNVRGNGSPAELGNQVSIIPVTIPLDIPNLGKLLRAVHERTEFLKRARVAEMFTLAGGLLGVVPAALSAVAGPLAMQLPITPFNLVCTNVPGPTVPLYLMGHKLLAWYPYVPIGGDMSINSAILSYNGTVYFGFTGDAKAAPDLVRLEKFLKTSMQELRKAAGIRQQRRSPRPKARAAAAGTGVSVATLGVSTPAPSVIPAARRTTPAREIEPTEIATAEVA